ncbi:phage holin [bacterium]|nr:phage holin [bacterium]
MLKIIALLFQGVFQISLLAPEEQQVFADMVQQVIIDIIGFFVIVISIIVPVLLRTLHQKINSAKNNEQLSMLASYAEIAVKAAEQSIAEGKGTEKMAYASKFLADAAKFHGVKILSEDMIKTLLEAAVFAVKKEIKEEPLRK